VHAQFDPASDTMRYANAGHPPMLILSAPPGASRPAVRAVCAPGEPALGVVSGQAYTERDTAFYPGETLIGFTDGLVERRGEDLTDGIAAIVAGLQALPHDVIRDTEALADAVLSLAPQEAGDDDATIIVLTREPDARRAAGFAESREISWAVSSREG
jgi:serine phosphatase RsbU (regulator of sigma subunit)